MMRDPAPHVVVANLSKEEARLLARLVRERIIKHKASARNERQVVSQAEESLANYLDMCILFADGKENRCSKCRFKFKPDENSVEGAAYCRCNR